MRRQLQTMNDFLSTTGLALLTAVALILTATCSGCSDGKTNSPVPETNALGVWYGEWDGGDLMLVLAEDFGQMIVMDENGDEIDNVGDLEWAQAENEIRINDRHVRVDASVYQGDPPWMEGTINYAREAIRLSMFTAELRAR